MENDTHRTQDPASPRRPRLVRRREGRILGGVAGGIADHFDVDPLVPRLVFAALALYGGLGIVVYLVCWVVIPADSPQDTASGGSPVARALGVVLLVIAGLVALRLVGGIVGPAGPLPLWSPIPWRPWHWGGNLPFVPDFWPLRPSILVALVLVVLGIALYRGGQRPPGEPAHGPGHAPETGQGQATRPVPPPPSPGTPRGTLPEPPSAPRPPSMLGRLTLAVALTVLGVAALLNRAAVVDLGPAQLLALGLIVVGFGLVVGAWWGRARWLIAVGFGLLPFLIVAALVSSPPWSGPRAFSTTAESQLHQPARLEDLRPEYGMPAGQLVLDLTALELPEGEEAMASVDITAGQIDVVLPAEADAALRARALVGSIRLPDREAGGLVISEEVLDAGDGSAGLVRLDLSVTAGEIQVRRSVAEPPASSIFPRGREAVIHALPGTEGDR